jgi:hypothetical protein
MVSQCVTAIKGRMMRVIKLDTCGNPVTGASSSMVVSNGFISIKPDPQYEDGVEFLKRVADGSFCVNQKDDGQLKRIKLTTQVCTLDPDMLVLMTGARLLSNGATGTGAAWSDLSPVNNHYSLEVWQDVAGRGACNAAGQQQYVYWAFPNISNTQLQSWMMELGTLEFSVDSQTNEFVSTRWGTGTGWSTPWLGTNSLQIGDHFAYNVTTVPPPASVCGAQALSG